MKALRKIRRSGKIHVDRADINGGSGILAVNGWKGTVIWGTNEDGWEHVSVSPFNHDITPDWKDLCDIKGIFWDEEEEVLQFFPKKSQYVNIQKNCLHMWRPTDPELQKKLEAGR